MIFSALLPEPVARIARRFMRIPIWSRKINEFVQRKEYVLLPTRLTKNFIEQIFLV